jgi:hypothetical protein
MQQAKVIKAATTITKSLVQVIPANLKAAAGSYAGDGTMNNERLPLEIDPRNLYSKN